MIKILKSSRYADFCRFLLKQYPLCEIPHSYIIQARNGPGLIIHLDHVYKCGNIMTDRANLIDPYLSV